MCCLFAVAGLIGPRVAIVVWWLLDPLRWQHAFPTTWVWPLLGSIFLPWTTLAYTLVFFGGVHGWEWILIVLGVIVDITSWGGGARSSQRA